MMNTLPVIKIARNHYLFQYVVPSRLGLVKFACFQASYASASVTAVANQIPRGLRTPVYGQISDQSLGNQLFAYIATKIIALILAYNSDPQAPSTDKRGAKEVVYAYSDNPSSLQLAGGGKKPKTKKRNQICRFTIQNHYF